MKKKISLVLVLALCMVAGVAKADFTFGTPTNLGPTINTSSVEAVPDISADDLSLIFASDRSGGDDLWVATRTSTEDDWRTPVNLGPTVNSTYSEASISISADGLTLFFDDYPSPRPGGVGGVDIWVATRPTVSNSWGTPVNLGWPFNSERLDGGPSISADGLTLFLYSSRSGGHGGNDIWVARRPTTSDPWSTPVNLGPPVNSSAGECCPSISTDGRMLFFGSNRGGSAGYDLWVTTRASVSDPWGPPVNLGATVNSSTSDDGPSISADGSTLYFMSNRPGGYGNYDLWQAPIIPIVDFNGDFKVDIEDLIILINNWGTDDPLCDIGPMPWGDGIVDVQDLIVLAEHLFEEIFPVELMEYWKLDEAEGDIAYNSIGDNHGVLSGDPIWQPNSGQVAGALEFDGIDDYISTDFVLNPADGPFSIFAWIKGGAAGQVILSQAGGVNWLMAAAIDGALKTDLKEPATLGRDPRPPGPPLTSSTVITNGDWHRVGFVRDGINRILYVDDIEVIHDTATNLESASGGLYIGAGSDLESGTFFSGLIDDVRIYNVALSAEDIEALAQ